MMFCLCALRRSRRRGMSSRTTQTSRTFVRKSRGYGWELRGRSLVARCLCLRKLAVPI